MIDSWALLTIMQVGVWVGKVKLKKRNPVHLVAFAFDSS